MSDTGTTSPAPTATAVLEHVVRSIVDDPSAVVVDAAPGRHRVRLEVRVGEGDLGRVIGKRGKTAQAIRTLVRAAASKDEVDVDVDFVQYWNISNERADRSHSVKCYNPWIGKPYIMVDDKTYYLSEGEYEDHWDNVWHDSCRGQHVYYRVSRLGDSEDFKEYELIIYD